MKNILLYSAFLLSTTSVNAQDYYWVGDSGNWSDLNHWATSSGGSEFHTELPGPDNNIYFDANSFTTAGQSVTIDLEEVSCHDLVTTGVQFNPSLNGVGFYDEMFIYGDLILTNELDRNLKTIHMLSASGADIQSGGKLTCFALEIEGTGVFQQLDSLPLINIYFNSGAFETNGFPLLATARIIGQGGQDHSADFGNSNVYCDLWNMDGTIDLNMSEATLYYGSSDNYLNIFDGGNRAYNEVFFMGLCEISGDNTYSLFEAMPGAQLIFEAGSTQSADQFMLVGESSASVSLSSSESGVQATLSQSSGSVDANYLILSDNAAIGGAIFNANNSVDQGNNTGWNITEIVPEDYFWVGGSGSWTDLSHWATSSGGVTFHEEPPSAVDDVYFDENSGLTNTDTVNLEDLNVSLLNISIENVNGASIAQGFNGSLNVYGDFFSDGSGNLQFEQMRMESSQNQSLNAGGGSLGEGCVLLLTGGGTVDLQSNIYFREMEFVAGNFNANGYTIEPYFRMNFDSSFDGIVDLTDASVITRTFLHNGNIGNIILDNSSITVSSSLYGGNLIFPNVTLDENPTYPVVNTFGSFVIEDLTITPGSSVEFQAGQTITIESFTAEGSEEMPISIQSNQPGNEAFLSKASGEVFGYYLNLTDNHAIGGAVFNAVSSQIGTNVEGWNLSTGLTDVFVENLKIYPNPVKDQLWVDIPEGASYRILDLNGRSLEFDQSQVYPTSVDLSDMPGGIYLMDVFIKGQLIYRQRIVIEP